MQRMGVSLIIAVLALGFAAAKPTPAHAQFEYCNMTSYYLFTALGHETRNGDVRTEGWWRVRPGECRVVEREPLDGGSYFTYAESHPAHHGGIRTWGGRTRLCTNRGLFTIDEQSNCFSRGFEPREFARINTGEESAWTTNLTESADYPAERARHAAAQRLLNELGYEAGTVDGYLGRRTRNAITRFKNDYDVEDDAIVSNELLDALITRVAETRELSGYQFCNRTDIELYAAMGYTEGDAWRTEGWWALQPGTCTKALNDTLPAEQIYTYAVGYDPEGDPVEFGGDYPLCTGDQAFQIVGNGDCESRGYVTVGFERVETEGSPGWVQEFVLDNGRPRAGMRNMQAEVNGAGPN